VEKTCKESVRDSNWAEELSPVVISTRFVIYSEIIRPKLRWEGNIRMDLREVGLEDVNWIHLVEDVTSNDVTIALMLNFFVS
jgi:hypothetical protein